MTDIFTHSVFDSLPRHVQKALLVFTDQERALLTPYFNMDTWEFEFIAFHDSVTNRATKPAEERKLAALDILDEEYRRWEKEVLNHGE